MENGIFEDESFLPSQYEDQRKRRVLSPEHLLLIAIVKQSERDLFSAKPHIRQRAREWFLSKDKTHPYAFSVICEHLNKSPKVLRRYARRTTATKRVRDKSPIQIAA